MCVGTTFKKETIPTSKGCKEHGSDVEAVISDMSFLLPEVCRRIKRLKCICLLLDSRELMRTTGCPIVDRANFGCKQRHLMESTRTSQVSCHWLTQILLFEQ